jgi:hypothetical protein
MKGLFMNRSLNRAFVALIYIRRGSTYAGDPHTYRHIHTCDMSTRYTRPSERKRGTQAKEKGARVENEGFKEKGD